MTADNLVIRRKAHIPSVTFPYRHLDGVHAAGREGTSMTGAAGEREKEMKKEVEILSSLERNKGNLDEVTQGYANILVKILCGKELHVCCAESCTAGLVAAAIASVPGASSVMDKSFVTYSERAKAELVGVSMSTIKGHGVVSMQVAKEMANGAFRHADRGVGIGVTGYAGPSGDPVGKVCFGIRAAEKGGDIEKDVYIGTSYVFTGDRNTIRKKAAAAALALAILAVDSTMDKELPL